MLFPFLCPKQKSSIRSRHSFKKSNESNSHFEKSESHFRSKKPSDSHEKPQSEFPTLAVILMYCTLTVQYSAPTKGWRGHGGSKGAGWKPEAGENERSYPAIYICILYMYAVAYRDNRGPFVPLQKMHREALVNPS